MKGFRVFDSVRELWFWWNEAEYSHWWDGAKKVWVKFSADAEKSQQHPPDKEPGE